MTCNSNIGHKHVGLDSGEEAQLERGGDLDGLQGEAGRVEREGDRIYHLRVHQQLGTLTTVSQASLKVERREHMGHRQFTITRQSQLSMMMFQPH